jgi:light-regulated signal transduction histidine kinase (bacteriophytochrome)
MVPSERIQEEDRILDRVRNGQRMEHLETVRLTKDGRRLDVSVTVSSVTGEDGQIIGASKIVRDITDRKQAEEALRRSAEDLARSNKDLEQFAYVASHDLQEPLRAVTGFVQLLQQQYGKQLDAKANDYIGYTVDGAKRMQTLIADLLTYSRVGSRSRELKPTDTAASLKRALENLTASIGESAAEITHGELPTVQADEAQLVQLFQNLVGNAIKFRGPEPPKIHVEARRNHDHWLFSVRDNGIGMNPEFSDRIFMIFQRLHSRKKYAGTGIGLAICKKIVERHGGQIWVESQPDQGATFYFTLPV